MEIPKPTEADKERFRSLVPQGSGIEIKPMFGNLGAFVNGNMFMGLFGSDIGIKLAPADAEKFKATEGARPFGPAERPMGGYLTLPVSLPAGSPADWIARSLAFVAALPPKAAKK